MDIIKIAENIVDDLNNLTNKSSNIEQIQYSYKDRQIDIIFNYIRYLTNGIIQPDSQLKGRSRMTITTKGENSSTSSSSYTAESLANEVTEKIYKNTKGWDEEDRKIIIYRQIRDTIKNVAKDTLTDCVEKQRVFRMSVYTDLEKILRKLEVD